MTKPIICDCGTYKDIIQGTAICSHCDAPCRAAARREYCVQCSMYSATTSNRASLEYAAEKRRNGR